MAARQSELLTTASRNGPAEARPERLTIRKPRNDGAVQTPRDLRGERPDTTDFAVVQGKVGTLARIRQGAYMGGMNQVAFDTLKLARGLEDAGFAHDQAIKTAEVLSENLSGSVVTREHFDHTIEAFRKDMLGLSLIHI